MNQRKINAKEKVLPPGRYIIKILDAELCSNRKRNGYRVKITYDIASGKYKDFFDGDYKNQDGETPKWHGYYYISVSTDLNLENLKNSKFRKFITAIEDSNQGYRFNGNINSIIGATVGGILNYRQYTGYDGSMKKIIELEAVCSVDEGSYQ